MVGWRACPAKPPPGRAFEASPCWIYDSNGITIEGPAGLRSARMLRRALRPMAGASNMCSTRTL